MNQHEFIFIDGMGLYFEKSGGSRTLGRVFGYLLLADHPKTLDEIAQDLIFSKATSSLTIRQGLFAHLFQKVSIPGRRKIHYQINMQSWPKILFEHISAIDEGKKLMDFGLSLIEPVNTAAMENIQNMKDYFDFLRWYLADLPEQYETWKKESHKTT